MKKPALILITLIAIVFVLSVVRIFVSNNISTSGATLGKIEEELSYYKTQNALINEKLLTDSSFLNLASKAAKLGFVEGKSNFVLANPVPLAVKQ